MSEVTACGPKGARPQVLIDEPDHAALAGHYWQIGTDGYPRRKSTAAERAAGAPCRIAMHREVLGLHLSKGRPGDAEVDHINRNRLDNRRANLRVVSRALNNMNRQGGGKYSAAVGVSFFKPAQLWRAYINMAGKRRELGYFKTEAAAIVARSAAAASVYSAESNKAQDDMS